MSRKYLIALNFEARRARIPMDLAEALPKQFEGRPVRVLEGGFKGRSVTVEMSDSLVSAVQDAFPFTTIELAREMDLLKG